MTIHLLKEKSKYKDKGKDKANNLTMFIITNIINQNLNITYIHNKISQVTDHI
jgi:hypothetical protein